MSFIALCKLLIPVVVGFFIFLQLKNNFGKKSSESQSEQPTESPPVDIVEWLRKAAVSKKATRMYFDSGEDLLYNPTMAQDLLDWLDTIPETHIKNIVLYASQSLHNFLDISACTTPELFCWMDKKSRNSVKNLLPRDMYVYLVVKRRQLNSEALIAERMAPKISAPEKNDLVKSREIKPSKPPRDISNATASILTTVAAGVLSAALSKRKNVAENDCYDAQLSSTGNGLVNIYKNGHKHSSRSLNQQCTGRFSVLDDCFLVEKSFGRITSWDVINLAHGDRIGTYQTEMKAREAIRRRRK